MIKTTITTTFASPYALSKALQRDLTEMSYLGQKLPEVIEVSKGTYQVMCEECGVTAGFLNMSIAPVANAEGVFYPHIQRVRVVPK